MVFPSPQFWRVRFPKAIVNIRSPSSNPSILVQIPWTSRVQTRRMATIIINSPRDPNTLSNYNNWVSTHITANFDILFDQRKLAGNVVHRFKSRTNGESKEIILDTNHLDIGDVKVNGESSKWELLRPLEPYGNALKITLQGGVELNGIVEVDVCPYRFACY